MHKPMSPHRDYNYMDETINIVNNFKVEKVKFNYDKKVYKCYVL